MKVFSSMDVGKAVRDARKAAGLTQHELAELCNCGVRFLSELENGKPTIELGRAMRVLNTLSLDVEINARRFG
jgi:y4mF family transcriptional regulator